MGFRHGQRPLHLRHADAAQASWSARLSEFLGTEDTILYSSCFDANGGVFEVLFGAEDAIISDELNHASLIDGIRLCKARRYRYRNADMADLRAAARGRRGRAPHASSSPTASSRWTATSPRSTEICDLADQYGAMVWSTTRHAVGLRRRRAVAARPSSSA